MTVATFAYWPIWAVPVAVQVIVCTDRQGVLRAGDRPHLVVDENDVVDDVVAVVGHHVGPLDRVADLDQWSGGLVGVVAVGDLLDVDARLDPEVVGGVGVGQWVPEGVDAR